MAVRARWRDERSDFVDEFERREHQFSWPALVRFGVVIDHMFGVVLVQMFEREGRSRAVAQQAL